MDDDHRHHQSPPAPDAPSRRSDTDGARRHATLTELERVIERSGTRHSAGMRALSAELGRRLQVAGPDSTTTEAGADEPGRELAGPAAPVEANGKTSPSPGERAQTGPAGILANRVWAALRRITTLLAVMVATLVLLSGVAVWQVVRRPPATVPPLPLVVGSSQPTAAPVATTTAAPGAPIVTLVVATVGASPAAQLAEWPRAIPSPSPPAATSTPRPPAVAQPPPVTAAPAVTPTPAPTTAVVAARPANGMVSAGTLRQRVAAAEAEWRTGQLDATIDYGNGSTVALRIRFDLGDATHPSRIHVVSTYHGATGSRTVERVMIGDRSWQRMTEGRWTVEPSRDEIQRQLWELLPQVELATNPTAEERGGEALLRWYDAPADRDMLLTVDLTTAAPRELRQQQRGTGLVITVTYSGRNTPIEIAPPPVS